MINRYSGLLINENELSVKVSKTKQLEKLKSSEATVMQLLKKSEESYFCNNYM